MAYVIKSWVAETKPIDEAKNFVRIVARKQGIISYIFSLFGIDATIVIKVGMDRIEYSKASLAGFETRLIPLQGICSKLYGFHKPWKEALSFRLWSVLSVFRGRSCKPNGDLGFCCNTFRLVFCLALLFP